MPCSQNSHPTGSTSKHNQHTLQGTERPVGLVVSCSSKEVSVANTAQDVVALARRLQSENVDRDNRMRAVQLVRTGQANRLYKGIFPSEWPQPIVANTIDVVAQDLSESVGTLPTFTAAGDSILDESKRSRAD